MLLTYKKKPAGCIIFHPAQVRRQDLLREGLENNLRVN